MIVLTPDALNLHVSFHDNTSEVVVNKGNKFLESHQYSSLSWTSVITTIHRFQEQHGNNIEVVTVDVSNDEGLQFYESLKEKDLGIFVLRSDALSVHVVLKENDIVFKLLKGAETKLIRSDKRSFIDNPVSLLFRLINKWEYQYDENISHVYVEGEDYNDFVKRLHIHFHELESNPFRRDSGRDRLRVDVTIDEFENYVTYQTKLFRGETLLNSCGGSYDTFFCVIPEVIDDIITWESYKGEKIQSFIITDNTKTQEVGELLCRRLETHETFNLKNFPNCNFTVQVNYGVCTNWDGRSDGWTDGVPTEEGHYILMMKNNTRTVVFLHTFKGTTGLGGSVILDNLGNFVYDCNIKAFKQFTPYEG